MTGSRGVIAESTSDAALATGQGSTAVLSPANALVALKEAIDNGTLTTDVRLALIEVARKAELPILESTAKEYPDSRPGCAPHRAMEFRATLPTEWKAYDLLVSLLGKANADHLASDWGLGVLISDWKQGVDYNIDAPRANHAVLIIDANVQALNRDNSEGEKRDFEAAGLEVGDDLQATIICAALVRKARDAGLDLSTTDSLWRERMSETVCNWDANERDLLFRLRGDTVRTRSGGLVIDANDGCLRAGRSG